jgi:hypothetical protein
MRKFLLVLMAVCFTFAMISCGGGDSGGGGTTGYKITKDANYDNAPNAGSVRTDKAGKLTTAKLGAPADRANYDFDAWYSAAVGGDVIDEDTEFEAAATIYAQWTIAAGVDSVTITFDENFPGAVAADFLKVDIVEGDGLQSRQLATKPAQKYRGYAFDKWTSTAAGGTDITVDTTFDVDTVIYAQWTALTARTISFNVNYTGADPMVLTTTLTMYDDEYLSDLPRDAQYDPPASGSNPRPVTEGRLPADPERPGPTEYAFGGWYTTSTATVKIDWEDWYVTGNQTVFAKWLDRNLTCVEADGFVEKLHLGNAALAIYKFTLPPNATFEDYQTISAQYKVDAASTAYRTRNNRIYGEFSRIFEADGFDPEALLVDQNFYGEEVVGLNANTYNVGGYIIAGNSVVDYALASREPNTWFEIVYDWSTQAHSGWTGLRKGTQGKPQDGATGPFYFGLGIPGNRSLDGEGGDGNTDADNGITQYVKNIRLVPKAGRPAYVTAVYAEPVYFDIDGEDVGAFMGYINQITEKGPGLSGYREIVQAGTPITPVTPTGTKITFDLTGAGLDIVKYVTSGSAIGTLLPAAPVGEYNFLGWCTTNATKWDTPPATYINWTSWTAPASATTVYAVWDIPEPCTCMESGGSCNCKVAACACGGDCECDDSPVSGVLANIVAAGDHNGTGPGPHTFLRTQYGSVVYYDFTSLVTDQTISCLHTKITVKGTVARVGASTGDMKLTFKKGFTVNGWGGGSEYQDVTTDGAFTRTMSLADFNETWLVGIQHNDGGNTSSAQNIEFQITITEITFHVAE